MARKVWVTNSGYNDRQPKAIIESCTDDKSKGVALSFLRRFCWQLKKQTKFSKYSSKLFGGPEWKGRLVKYGLCTRG